MTRISILLCLLLFGYSTASAQHQYDQWCFGQYVGLDFRQQPPKHFSTSMNAEEGCASICDETSGELLFYTNGVQVWNSRHELLPSLRDGSDIGGDVSSTQSAVIIRKPCSKTSYYIFSVKTGVQGFLGKLFYSEVDLSKDDGRGDIIRKKVPLFDSISEKVTAIYSKEDCQYWVLVHHAIDDRFYSYAVDREGVNEIPVVTAIGSQHFAEDGSGLGRGSIVGSPNGDKLAISVVQLKYIEVFDFDRASGKLANPITLPGVIDEYYQFYGLAFSPDGSKLYATRPRPVQSLIQFDLLAGDATAVAASKYVVTTTEFTGHDSFFSIMPAPNAKLYTGAHSNNYLSAVNKPNLKGAACEFQHRAIEFAVDSPVTAGLPNIIASYMDGPGVESGCADCALEVLETPDSGDRIAVSLIGGGRVLCSAQDLIRSVEVYNVLGAVEYSVTPSASSVEIDCSPGQKFMRIRTDHDSRIVRILMR